MNYIQIKCILGLLLLLLLLTIKAPVTPAAEDKFYYIFPNLKTTTKNNNNNNRVISLFWDPDHLSNEPPLEGPPIPITIDMVKKAISKMKSGKAAGPSGIVVEMIKAAGDTGATMIRDLATAIIRDGKVPTYWEESFIVCLYKGKGDALDRGNYRGLKLTEQAMKILERIVDGLIRQVLSIDDSQFGFVPGRGTTDAIFVVRQL